VQDALHQFSETEAFRKANDIEVLYDTMDIEAYEESKKLVREAQPSPAPGRRQAHGPTARSPHVFL
jgi:hypothetical protein